MAPSRKGKGKETAGSEAESSQTHVRGRNAYMTQPADPQTRPVLRMTGYRTFDAGRPEHTEKVNQVISEIICIHYPGPFSRYTDFPEETQSVIKAEFLKHYQFAEEVDENEVWDTFRRIADKRLQDMLNKAKVAVRKSYGDSILSLKEHSAPHPHEWIMPDSWPGVMNYWCSDAFANRSQRNKINRAAAGESSGATTGSVNMLVHKQRFKKCMLKSRVA